MSSSPAPRAASPSSAKLQFVLTKTDLVKDPRELARRWWHVNEEVQRLGPRAIKHVHMVSARTGAGVLAITKELQHLHAKPRKKARARNSAM